MKIGIDARMLCRPVTGIERYAFEVVREITQQDPAAEVHLYAPLALKVQFDNAPSLAICHSNIGSRPGRIFWAQTLLPYWANRDHVDVFWGPTHRMPSFLSGKVARVVTIHDLVWKHAGETMRPLNRLAEKILMPEAIRLADRIAAVSQSTADAIALEFPRARDKTRVVHPGVTAFPEPGQFESLERLGINRPYFLFVGTLEPRKNLRRLLEAYAALDVVLQRRCLLVIAGGKGWGNEDLAKLVRDLGLGDSVRLTGYVDEATLATLYRHTRFLAMPSLYEGFGLPLVEAMSFGVPVLTSSCSSLLEVAGDAGVLVNPLSVDSIAAGMAELIADDRIRDRLALRAKENAARFNWKNTAKKMLEIFDEAIQARRQRGDERE